jgi:hypothetical protein
MYDRVVVDRGEPVDLVHAFGLRRVQRWRRGTPNTWREEHVEVGQLGDGRWYAAHRNEARAYSSEGQARQVAGQLMAQAGDGWVDDSGPPAPPVRYGLGPR